MDYTIERLISDVNEVAKRSTPQQLRILAFMQVRDVLRQIGIEYTGVEMEEEIEIEDKKYYIPDRTISVQGIGQHQGKYDIIELRQGEVMNRRFSYMDKSTHLFFPSLEQGKLWALTYQFNLDEYGEPLIPEEAYNACYDACMAKLAFQNPTSPHWQDRWILQRKVPESIRIARGLMNETSPSRLRANRII
jgi:hypothetical protein